MHLGRLVELGDHAGMQPVGGLDGLGTRVDEPPIKAMDQGGR